MGFLRSCKTEIEAPMLQVKIFSVTQFYSEYLSTNRIKISAKTKKFCLHIRVISHYKMGHTAAILFLIFMFYTPNRRDFYFLMITIYIA